MRSKISEDQQSTINESREKVIKLLDDYSWIVSESKHKAKHGEGFKTF